MTSTHAANGVTQPPALVSASNHPATNSKSAVAVYPQIKYRPLIILSILVFIAIFIALYISLPAFAQLTSLAIASLKVYLSSALHAVNMCTVYAAKVITASTLLLLKSILAFGHQIAALFHFMNVSNVIAGVIGGSLFLAVSTLIITTVAFSVAGLIPVIKNTMRRSTLKQDSTNQTSVQQPIISSPTTSSAPISQSNTSGTPPTPSTTPYRDCSLQQMASANDELGAFKAEPLPFPYQPRHNFDG